jgi:NAD(P)-dependent dehydrogenase (short-subunit alcohol dehydrogenase family)
LAITSVAPCSRHSAKASASFGPVLPLAALYLHELGNQLLAPAVQAVLDRLALSLQPQPRAPVLFLASEESAYVVAQMLNVDGGN